MTVYLSIATFIFSFLALIWNRENFPNLFIKTIMFCMAIASGFFLFNELGFIVKSQVA